MIIYLVLTIIIFLIGVDILKSGKDTEYRWRGGIRYELVTYQGKRVLYVGLAYTIWGGGFAIDTLRVIILGEEGSSFAFLLFVIGSVLIAIVRSISYAEADKQK